MIRNNLSTRPFYNERPVQIVLLALGLGEVSVVIPLAGTAPLFVLFLAYLFPSGAAKLGWRVVAGAVLIVLGVFLLTGR